VDEQTGARVFFKCENLQRAGAFKFRGAYNALARLDPAQQRRGVVAYSSGNHAQAVALAGRLLGIPCVIVMPADAPPVKRAATAEYGAEIVLYDRQHENREAIGQRLAAERCLAIVPPFDHPHIVAGAGTPARELFDEVGTLDLLLAPCGGGGLLSGCSLAAGALSPGCRIIGVEPAAGDDAKRSLETRELQTVHNPHTVADGARTASLGTITFPLVLNHVSAIVTVDDVMLVRTMFFLWERLKLVVEPTGALAAAALLNGRLDGRGRRIGVVLSGGNVDFSQVETWRRML
jgi:threonine dehydratase